LGAPGGEYTTVLRVTFPGLVVLVFGLVVTGASVTVGGVVLAGEDVTVGAVVLAGGAVVLVGGALPTVPRGTVIAGGGAVVGPAGGSGGTGIVWGPTVVTVVGMVVVVDRRLELSEDPDRQTAKVTAAASAMATATAAAITNRREVTGGSVPYRTRAETAREIRRM
jgi:hypothetical protein